MGIEPRIDPAQTAALPLAFDRVPLDQPQVRSSKARGGRYVPSQYFGRRLDDRSVLWLVGVV
jgi:hypothetical protein